MTDETAGPPPPVFPQYERPNPNAVPVLSQKPLMKLINRRLHPPRKSRVSPVKKRLARKKRDEYSY
jgi:hypothetical protein